MNKCKGTLSQYSRISGYFQPLSNWNPGKGVKGEFGDRKLYKIVTVLKGQDNESSTVRGH